MAYNDLREWIAALEKAGELKRITAEVDPVLEVTEITDRVSKWGAKNGKGPGGPALLFENVKGHPGHKIFINQFGSERRMNLALGSKSLDEIAQRIHQMMDVKTPQGLLEKIKMLPMLAELGNMFPKRVATRAVQGSDQARQFFAAGFSDSAVLAAGWRAVHYPAVRDDARSADGEAQRWDVSHARV